MFKNTGVNKCRKSAIHSEDGGLNDALKLARRLIKYTKKDTDNTRQGDEARELTDSAKLRARRDESGGCCLILWVSERLCLD